jgi:hypothetical protein
VTRSSSLSCLAHSRTHYSFPFNKLSQTVFTMPRAESVGCMTSAVRHHNKEVRCTCVNAGVRFLDNMKRCAIGQLSPA